MQQTDEQGQMICSNEAVMRTSARPRRNSSSEGVGERRGVAATAARHHQPTVRPSRGDHPLRLERSEAGTASGTRCQLVQEVGRQGLPTLELMRLSVTLSVVPDCRVQLPYLFDQSPRHRSTTAPPLDAGYVTLGLTARHVQPWWSIVARARPG